MLSGHATAGLVGVGLVPVLCFPCTSRFGELFREELFIRQHHMVFGRQHFVRQPLQGIMRDGGIGTGAQNQADWWIFPGQSPVLTCVVAVHVHLAHVGVIEFGELQVDDNQAPQTAMKKQKIHPKPAFANAKPTLAAYKRRIAAELKQEIFEPADQRVFQLRF